MLDQGLSQGPSLESSPHERWARRRFVLICMCFVLLCLALKPMTWFAPRAESDEQIYWTLARSLYHRGQYSIQGTGAIEALHLPAYTYDRPLFIHPPLFPALLIPFAAAGNPNAAIGVSWLGHILSIVGVGLAAWAWRRPWSRGTEVTMWLPVLAVAVDPLMTFCSRKLWMDGLVGGLDALGLGLTAMAVARHRASWAFAAGMAFGLAGLTKLTGLLPMLPAVVWTFAVVRDSTCRRRMLGGLVAPAFVLVLPWLVLFRLKCGAWLPHWVEPPAELVDSVPHVARAVGRRWHYYLTQSAIIAPVTLACAVRMVMSRGDQSTRRSVLGCGTILMVGIALLVMGLRGQGMQMRYLTPAVGGLYALLAAQLGAVDSRRSLFPAIVMACVLFGCIQTGFYLQAVEFDEILSLPEMTWKALGGAPAGGGGG